MISRFLLLAVLLSITAGLGAAQQAPSPAGRAALAGVIRDSVGTPLAQVTIAVEVPALSTVTDDSGRFHLAGIPAGESWFTVTRLGYQPRSFSVMLPRDSTVLVALAMRPLPTLPTVEVKDQRSRRLVRVGYYERQRTGFGKFVSPQRVDSLSWVSTPARLLRDIPGVVVMCAAAGRCGVKLASGRCLNLVVDGGYHWDSQIDDVLSTSEVYAIEVYTTSLRVPVEFLGPKRRSGCGALVVWTHAFAR
jgi:hypothetical protein